MGQANEAIQRVDEQSAALHAERELLLNQAAGERIGTVSVDALLMGGRYDLQLRADLQALSETRETLMQELARRQQVLVEAQSEVKRFERLREREEAAHNTELLRRQQAEADEIAGRRYNVGRPN